MEYLDFELPIKELEDQLDKCQIIGQESDVDVSNTCKQIEKKLEETKKKIYKNLTAWQRVQLSRHPNRPYTLEHITTISTGLNNPRYIAFSNGKGYVTNWGDGTNPDDDYVAVVNLSSNTITTSIPVVEGPERILEHNNKLYVAHIGGFGFGNSISVIQPNNNIVSSILVEDVPNSMVVVNNDLYVLCGGKPSWSESETSGSLIFTSPIK